MIDDSPAVTASLLDSLENDARLQTFLRGHTAPIRSVAFSRDGRLMASAGDDLTIRLWSAETWQPVAVLKHAHTKRISSLAFSPDGSMLASASLDETVRLWKTASAAPIGPPLRHGAAVVSVVFDPAGTTLWSSGSGETLQWDLRAAPPSAKRFSDRNDAGNLALSPDGRVLAIGIGGTISLWNTGARRPLPHVLETEGTFPQGLAFTPDGNELVATDDFGLTMWDLSGATPKRTVPVDNVDFTSAIAVSPNGKLLASGGDDPRIRLWNLESNRQVPRPLIGHTGFVTAIAFHPDGETFVSASEDGTLIVWTPEPHSRIRQSVHQPGQVKSVAFSSDDHLLATGSADGTILISDLASGKPLTRSPIANGAPVERLVFAAPDSLLTCGNDEVRRWNLHDKPRSSPPIPAQCSEGAFSEGGTMWAEMRRSGEPRELEEESDFSVTVSHTGSAPAHPRTAAVQMKGNRESLAISGDGRSLAASTENGDVYLWSLEANPPKRRELRGHAGAVPALAFSADGSILASGGHDGTIRLWNVATGTLRQPPREAPGRVDRVRFDSGGKRLVAMYGSRLKELPALQLWDLAAGIPIGAPLAGPGQGSIGNDVAISPSGRWIAAGGDEGDALVVDTRVATWRDQACRFANRNLSPTEEWPVYFPGQPYRKTCPNLPLPISIPRVRHDQEDEMF